MSKESFALSSPCVGSGLCCKTSACGYGVWDAQRKQCIYLETHYKDTAKEVEIFKCGCYEQIKDKPGANLMPAFGAGCCMGLFNTSRSHIISLYKAGDTGVIKALERVA